MAKILLVDDSPLLLKIGRSMLERGSHTVATAKDGKEAVAAAKSESPDIIFMDAEMPGMDGLEACRAIKGDPATKKIPLFICTGHDLGPDQTRRFKEAGATGWIQKPYQDDEFSSLIKKHT